MDEIGDLLSEMERSTLRKGNMNKTISCLDGV